MSDDQAPQGDQSLFLEELALSREARAKQFAAYLRRLIIDYQTRTGRWLRSGKDIAQVVGVSQVTVNEWLAGRKLPSRTNCIGVANGFGVLAPAVLTAAGYPVTQDDSYNTYQALLDAVISMPWESAKKEAIRANLIAAISPDFAFGDQTASWRELTQLVLAQPLPPETKAQRIALLIDLWQQERHEQQQHRHR